MGSTAVTGELIWPTQNDLYGANVGGAAGDGKAWYERQFRKGFGSVAGRNNYVLSGGALPATDPDLTIQIPTGAAIIEGHYCEWPATNITLPASNTSHIFVKLVFSGTLITGLEIEDNTSDTPPASSTKLGTATTSGSAVTSTTDARILGPGAVQVLTSGTSYFIPAGIYRIFVELFGASGGGGGGGEGGLTATTGDPGDAGGTGGTTTFGSLQATGGGGGRSGSGGGQFGDPAPGQPPDASTYGVGSGGSDNRTGCGERGVAGGIGGAAGGGTDGGGGGTSAEGGYASAWMSVTPGQEITQTIGSGGLAGARGSDVTGQLGTNGSAGRPGRIKLHF